MLQKEEKNQGKIQPKTSSPALTEAKVLTFSLADLRLNVPHKTFQLVVNVSLKRPNSAARSS